MMPISNAEINSDLLTRGSLVEVDPFVADLIRWEEERQARKLILIPSESAAPRAVREALGSVFQNVYAEGYPPLRMTRDSEERLRDVAWQLANYRRYGDRRFYKGVEYVHFVECLAQRRCAELFAHGTLRPEHILVNVQPLSGAAANLAVYEALLKPGDVLMGMDLFQGGHLTHGSRFNISGRRYKVVSYGVDPRTEQLDYEQIRALAREHRPRLIVAGFTSYPWAPDWKAFREIADEVGAYLMADIAHTAGLAAAGVYPNPVGIADITTFTTHKTICGPRGAVILTTDEALAQAIDNSVFPGAQGGPHVNKFAAMAVAFGIARGEPFRRLQQQIVANARALAEALQALGVRLAYGGTDTHLLLVDLKSLPRSGRSNVPLWGEPAVRILDAVGIVANKNTIPGDTETALATGIRLGTPWVTQRGLDEADMAMLAELIYRLLREIRPYAYQSLAGTLPRGKIPAEILAEIRAAVAQLAEKAGIDYEYRPSSYPHYFGLPQTPGEEKGSRLRIIGFRARQFLQQVTTANLANLAVGEVAPTYILDRDGNLLDEVVVEREPIDAWGRERYLLTPTSQQYHHVATWLRDLSDGYVLFDPDDLLAKIEGPVVIEDVPDSSVESTELPQYPPGTSAQALWTSHPERFDLTKPYFIGRSQLVKEIAAVASSLPSALPHWQWESPATGTLQRTPLYDIHRQLGAKMAPFAGWEMPLWYTSVSDEHRAVREAAGLFDIAHMGLLEVTGPHATAFLDAVCTNYVGWLEDGQSCYGYLLDPDGAVIDDVIVYRLEAERYLVVVNAANEAKDWDWLNRVNAGQVLIDRAHPWIKVEASAVLRNLKDPRNGAAQKRNLALQGPASLETLQKVAEPSELREALKRLRRTELLEGELAGVPAIIARTGYTGEEWGFEIFVHPDHLPTIWDALLEAGKQLGVRPAGLAARDSTRIEAGLPLYGHELAGPLNISPLEAGFAGYVKFHKPFFVGREALLAHQAERETTRGGRTIVRFRVDEKGTPRPQQGDPIANKRGTLIGQVTSCSIGSDGHLVGLALIDSRYADVGTSLVILPAGGEENTVATKRPLGTRVTLPVAATVLPRFLGRARGTRYGEE